MSSPKQPVTLSAEQVAELNRRLSTMRHDVSNKLTNILAAVSLLEMKPENARQMIEIISQQPKHITEAMKNFSAEFEKILKITGK